MMLSTSQCLEKVISTKRQVLDFNSANKKYPQDAIAQRYRSTIDKQ